jgi:histidine triad (HIT) family protein
MRKGLAVSRQDCIFCKIVSGDIPSVKVFENDRVLAFLDIGPISDGHMLVIPKQHCGRLDQASPEMMSDVARQLPILAAAVQKAMQAEGYNVLCNNGEAAGQVVEHMHFHIIPRSANDGVFNRWPSYQYAQGKADKIAEKIKENLSLL